MGEPTRTDWSALARGLGSLAESDRLSAVRDVAGAGESALARLMLQSVAERDASPAVRRAALDALRQAGGPVSDGPGLLGRELANRNPQLRERAAWTACVLRSPDLAFTLRQRLRAESEPRVRLALLAALAAVGAASDLLVVTPFLDAPEPAVRAAALRTAWMLAGADASTYLVRGLTDSSEEVRTLAMGVLASRGWPAVKALLAQMAASSIGWQAECAAVVLGGTRSSEAVEMLAPLRTHALDSVRSRADKALAQLARGGVQAAARALADGAPPDAEPPGASMRMSQLLQVPTAQDLAQTLDARAWARALLAEGRAERWNELARRLDAERDPAVAAFLVSCLGRLGAKAAVPQLLPYLAHPEARVRANTVEALRLLARADQLDALLPCLDDPDNRVRANALIALATHPAVDVPKRLAAMAASPREEMQLSALYVAEMLATPEAVAATARLASSAFEAVRKKKDSLAAGAAPSQAISARPSALLWGLLGLFCAGLLSLPFVMMPVADSPRTLERRETGSAPQVRPWMPELPPPRAPGTVLSRKSEPLVLPAELVAFLKSTRGRATTAELFDERWRSLYALLACLPQELRDEIATLAELTLLRGSLRSRPQEAAARLDEWIEAARQLLLPRLRAQEGR